MNMRNNNDIFQNAQNAQNALKAFSDSNANKLSQHRILTLAEVTEMKKSFDKLKTDHPILMQLDKQFMDKYSNLIDRMISVANLNKMAEEIHKANKKTISLTKKAVSVDAEILSCKRTRFQPQGASPVKEKNDSTSDQLSNNCSLQ